MDIMQERNTAVQLARQAGEILARRWGQPVQVESKGVINPVTEVDRASERLITTGLREAFPEYGLLAEEGSGWPAAHPGGPRWIIDPLDGTANYIRGIPIVAVSIGLEKDGELVLGVVYNPITAELFIGERGLGATLNGQPIHVTDTAEIGQAVLASGFEYDVWSNPDDNTREWRAFTKQATSVRCDGSAALDLCQVACGRFDGYWERSLSAWDIAAGTVIVREAGGCAEDYRGGGDVLERGEILAANPVLVRQMRQVLEAVRT
jgi:myo-inositol-1(or 4)-monophosphatase